MKKLSCALIALFFSIGIAHAQTPADKWQSYIDGTVGKNIYYLLNDMSPIYRCDAVDFGSGAGNEVVHLLKNGCRVLAIDLSPHSGDVVKERSVLVGTGYLDFQTTDFAHAKLSGEYNLFISYFALPFADKKDLPAILDNIYTHAKPGARMSVNFFGPEHSFVKAGQAFAVTEQEIKDMLTKRGFRIYYLLHREFNQKDFDNNDVHWDIFDVDAIKW